MIEIGRYWVSSMADGSGTSSPVQSGLGFPPVQAAQFLASTSSTPPKRGVVGLNTAVGGVGKVVALQGVVAGKLGSAGSDILV